jgi:hypothetical protein
MASISLEIAQRRLLPLLGFKHRLSIVENKGSVGHWLEKSLGIPHTDKCLDFTDGEMKSFPLKKLQSGSLVPKETIAVTMLNTDELLTQSFKSTRCYKKLSRCLYVPYYREGDEVEFLEPSLINAENGCFDQLEEDYEEIRKEFLERGLLKCAIGKLLQTRPKGVRNTVTRAYYLRKEFAKSYILQ